MQKNKSAADDGVVSGASVSSLLPGSTDTNKPLTDHAQVELGVGSARLLPRPLVPPDVDLSKLPAMLLDIDAVRNSRWFLRANRRPRIAFCVLNLIMRVFRERPAASIEFDEDVLMDAARCPETEWAEVRGYVLDGWVLCRDGRIYSPMVADMALAAHAREIDYAFAREVDRKRKADHRSGIKPADQVAPNFESWLIAKYPSSVPYLADIARVAPASLRDRINLSIGSLHVSAGHDGNVGGTSNSGPSESALKYESESEGEHEANAKCSPSDMSRDATPSLGSLTRPDEDVAERVDETRRDFSAAFRALEVRRG